MICFSTFAQVAQALSSVSREVVRSTGKAVVEAAGKAVEVTLTPVQGLRKATFSCGNIPTVALEQNPSKPSSWGQLAREGHNVVQFKQGDKYVAVAVDGEVRPYGPLEGSR